MNHNCISQGYLKSILHYEPETGLFTWIVNKSSRIKLGNKAGNISNAGYIRIGIDGVNYMAHRLAWIYSYDENPELHIDHIDENKQNNALLNLRLLTHAENKQNTRKPRSDNKIGVLGVYHDKSSNKYKSQININGKRTSLGYFDTVELAENAYLYAKEINHKSFNPDYIRKS